MIDCVENRVLMECSDLRARSWQGKLDSEEQHFVVLTKYYTDDQRNKNVMGGLCSMHGGNTCIRSFGWKIRRKVVTLKVQMWV